jgi:crotonobetainyl-CoA:carnitine CoA-transferase CaiB-like acyl-CoA transferase
MLAAGMGADVIRVDRPNSPVTDSPIMRRGKRSIELDLRSSNHAPVARAPIAP